MENKIIKSNVVLLSIITLFFFADLKTINAQDKIKQEVDVATILLVKDYTVGIDEFNKIGIEAIPYILEIIFDENKQSPFHIFRTKPGLMSVIAQFQSPVAEEGLIKILKHNYPQFRSQAAFFLGEKKSKKSVPYLVTLLDDKGVAGMENSSVHQREILVQESVVKSLEKIMDITLLPQEKYELKAKAWSEWWQNRCK